MPLLPCEPRKALANFPFGRAHEISTQGLTIAALRAPVVLEVASEVEPDVVVRVRRVA
jgi:hypothetical protein